VQPGEDNIVRIPADLVDWALKVAPSRVDIYNRKGSHVFELGNIQQNPTRFGLGVTNLYYQDPLSDKILPFTRKHMEITARMGQRLSSFDMVSTPGVIQDCGPRVADFYGTLEMAANTTKPLVILVSEHNCFETVLDLIEHLNGGQHERPFAIPYFNPITPLVLNQSTTAKMVTTIKRGLPFIYNSLGMSGANVPITLSGSLALLNAELLAGLVFSQLVQEGAPLILGNLPQDFDMKAMEGYYTARTLPLNLACAELMAHYGLPHSGSSGCGPGWSADLMFAGVLWMNHLTACLGKVGLAPFVGGRFGSTVFSPTLVAYSHEVIRQTRIFAQEFGLDNESVVVEEIKAVGPGGNFLMADQTVKLCRQTNCSSDIWPYLSLDDWQAEKMPKADDLLRRYTADLINSLQPPDDHDELMEKGEAFIRKAAS
jgi:trimethylamine--corrinoid protein Co-methyltransferase